ncbi:Cancer/testis antigen 14 [Macaca mulatta]|uniref:Cancer/testis antigen 14 n=1 Tax=Macaca mulatta TaxID=9544 RepID=G7NRN8_MACMU|nr:Cancer/testis antigen 14 [Macaca mulatta]
MQASPFRMSQLTPPEELHTVAYVFTNGGQQMRSDEVNPVAKGHQSKKKHSRKSKRHSSSKRRKSMSLWLDKQEDAAVTHNVHEERINNSQPAADNILSTAPPWPDATITHNICEERMENGQSQTDKVFSTVSPWLVHRAAAGIPSMNTRDLSTVTHNIREERMENGQPQPDNILSTGPTGLINMAATPIPATSARDLYATVTHNGREQKMENVQPAPDNVLLTLRPQLINMAATGISSMSTRDPDATITYNVPKEKMEKSQPQPDNVLSTASTGLINVAGAATVNHHVHEARMENSQPQQDNVLSNVLSGFINVAGASIPAMSSRDLGISSMSTRDPYATVTHNGREQKMENVQPAPDNVLLTLRPQLINMAATGISSMSTRDVTATHNVHEAKMKNDQQAPDNSLSTVPPGCTNLSGAGISTVIHDIQEEEMENGQIPPDGLLSNSDSPELINMTGHRMPPEALGSFSYDFTSLSKDELLYKPDSNEFAVGIKNYSVSAGDPPVTAMSSVETVPNTLQISPAMAKKINDDIKYQLMKEVRRFGQNYERIFNLLEEVQGSMKVKRQFVEFTIKEAARFKKVVLIQQLEKVLKEIDSHCHLRKVKHMRKK